MVHTHLINPVFNALQTCDAAMSRGTETAKYFDIEVSPFAGFDVSHPNGFDELYDLLPAQRSILYAHANEVSIPKNWQIKAHVPGLQFVLEHYSPHPAAGVTILPLDEMHVAEMIRLTALTRPGPFAARTIEFGNYFGIFENGQLVAMTGQRLHLPGLTEISAVCTHPNHVGKGYAAALLQHQIELIVNTGQTPFLHVRADNTRATDLYKRLGFAVSRPMQFYFLKKI